MTQVAEYISAPMHSLNSRNPFLSHATNVVKCDYIRQMRKRIIPTIFPAAERRKARAGLPRRSAAPRVPRPGGTM
jgi:hypothetical protein